MEAARSTHCRDTRNGTGQASQPEEDRKIGFFIGFVLFCREQLSISSNNNTLHSPWLRFWTFTAETW
jgi:hypothetical protein